jgi:phospholipid/cholesterol/gamma-HCH transport system substrate-binding protein
VSRALTRWQAVVLGVIVLLGLATGAYGLFQVGERQRLWNDRFTLTVGFPRLQGVGIGTPVRVRGLEAGTVAGIDLPDHAAADAPLTLRLSLDRRFQHLVFTDATATILNEGMIGAKVVEIDPGHRESGAVADGARIAAGSLADLTGLLKQAQEMLTAVRDGQGTLGKLMTDDKAYAEVLTALEQTRKLMEKSQATADSMRQDADAIKRLPIIRSYADNPAELLVRPTQQRHRTTIAAAALFEPGKAILTESGRAKLDELGPWFESLKIKGSDVVVAAYTDSQTATNSLAAQTLTQKQSEVVCEYLKEHQKIQKLGMLRWRDVKALGLGHDAPLMPPDPGAPNARVEINVFVPQS